MKITDIINEEINQEQKITLNDLYDDLPDHNEMIWNYVSHNDFDIPFTVETINPHRLSMYLLSQYHAEHIDDIVDMLDDDQKEIVDDYINSPNLSNQIIVMSNGKIIDGHHRALAAALKNKSIKYIDVAEENDEEELSEASGYIPSAKQKNDPRFKTALTVDVHPDAIKKNAKAFGFKTSRAGIPPTANPSGKF